MEQSKGVENLAKVLDFVVEGANVAEKIEKSKTWIGKATAILPITDEAIQLLGVDFKEIPAEYDDLSEAEVDFLYERVKAKYEIEDKDKEALVREGLDLAKEIIWCVEKVKSYATKWKK